MGGHLLGGFGVPVDVLPTAATTALTSSGMSALVNGTSAGGSGPGGVPLSAMSESVEWKIEQDSLLYFSDGLSTKAKVSVWCQVCRTCAWAPGSIPNRTHLYSTINLV